MARRAPPEQEVGGRPLLLIEDNPADADLVREYLLDAGEENTGFDIAGSLSEALEMLDGRSYAAVLLDLNLPDATGWASLDHVLGGGAAVPVIVLTGAGGDEMGSQAVARGAADFLPKDELSGRLLLRSIRYAVERSRRRDAEAQYRALVENSRDLVSILEHDLTIRYVSPSIRRVLGYRPEEKQGGDGSFEVHPHDRDKVYREVTRLLEDPTHVSHFNYRVRHEDGSWRHLDTIAQNCFDDPHIRGFVVNSRDTTELYETQERAEATARRLERTLGALQDAVFTVEPEDRTIVHCNAAAESIFGYAAEEMLGHSSRLLHVDEASFQRFHEDGLAALHEAGSYRTEFQMRAKDGRVFPVEVTVSLLDPDRGFEAGVVSVVRDMTERVERSRQVRFQSALLERVGQPVLAVDEHGRLTYWNHAAERLTGFGWAEVEGGELIDVLVVEGDRARALEARETAREEGRWEGELRLRKKDGGELVVQASKTSAVNPDGSPGGRIFSGVDITELRRAEERSRRAAERLRLQADLLEAVGQAVVATDLEGRIIYWNRAATELYGWTRDEALGQRLVELRPSDASREETAEIFHALRQGHTWTGTFEVRHRDGRTFQALVTDAPMYDEHGDLVGIIGVCSDISERITLEERLRQAEKMEAIGRLAAGVAHDFNNLLTAIEGHASFLLDESDEGSPLQEDVKEIREAGRRAADLTRQLLAFSRKQALQERNVDVGRVARELEAMLRRLVPERIDFEVRVETEDVVVRADPTQLQQLLMNLVVNAVDAIEVSGRITLEVDAKDVSGAEAGAVAWEMEPGPYARVTVSDDGSGMNPEVVSHIFEPFFTTKSEGQGTGLGLATVFGIVKQSGGHVFVDSTPGGGTSFEVLLPRIAAAATERGPKVSGTPPAPESAVVLVVEDDPAVRKVARRALSRTGCTVLEASNGQEALALADGYDGTIDVVFSDVVMPDMGGVELQKELQVRYPGLAVVLTSGHSEAEVHGNVREVGAAFVPKPFTPESLQEGLSKALRVGAKGEGRTGDREA